MKNRLLIMMVMLISMLSAQQAMAQGSVRHSGHALAHSAQAAGHSVVGTAKLASAAVAVPLVVAGGVGAASASAGQALTDAANSPIGEPLEVSDETLTVGPSPDQAIH